MAGRKGKTGAGRLASPPGCVCARVRQAARALTQIYDDALRPSGLRATQLALLERIHALGPVALGSLADAMVMDRTSLTRNLRPLEKQGLLRVRAGEDRRVREVVLTRKGVRAMERALPVWARVQKETVGALGGERSGRLLRDLSAVVDLAGGR